MSEGTVIWNGKATPRTVDYQDELVTFTPKITIFAGLYVGFGRRDQYKISVECWSFFRAWQAAQLLQRVERVRMVHRPHTVEGLVAALGDNLGNDNFCQLAEDFGISEAELRELLGEAKNFVPSAYELFDMWQKFTVSDKIKYLPELEEKLKKGALKSHPLIDSIIETSRKEVDEDREFWRKQREWEKAEEERKFAVRNALFEFLKDIGVKNLIGITPVSSKKFYAFDYSLDTAIMDELTAESTLDYLVLGTETEKGEQQLHIQLITGESASLGPIQWDSIGREFRIGIIFDDGQARPSPMSIPALRAACDMGEPGQKAPWLLPPPSFRQRLFRGR